MGHVTAVGVLDKAVGLVEAVSAGPLTLAELVAASGTSRATAHRLAVALETHGLLARTADGRWTVGGWPALLAAGSLSARAVPVLTGLRDATGETASLFERHEDVRRCTASVERASGLRDTIGVGSELPLTAGSAAQVLLAFAGDRPPRGSRFTAAALAAVREQGWAASVAEREAGVASVSAPVLAADGTVLGAVSVSGPVQRLTDDPGRLHGEAVRTAAAALSTRQVA